MKHCDGTTAAVLLSILLATACPDLAAEEKVFAESFLARARSAVQAATDEDERAARERTVENTVRVMGDIAAAGVWQNSPFACYAVPPMSSIKRLPDVIPPDGELADSVSVFAAKGEFEPASFVIVPFADFEEVELGVSDLLGQRRSVIRADAVDLKVVKCWYQAGTAWHSYFGDPTRRELVPELLLNDEDLIRVDHERRDNYLKIAYPEGSRHVWVSYTEKTDPGYFNYNTEPVADAERLRPIRLVAGEAKQIWLTVKVPERARAGIYSGTISFFAAGERLGDLKLALRVLPFELPHPMAYYDIDKKFYASIYNHCSLGEHLQHNGGNVDQAERKLLAEFENLRDHGCMYPLCKVWGRGKFGTEELALRQLQVLKKSGLATRPVFGGVRPSDYYVIFREEGRRPRGTWERFTERVDREMAVYDKVLGHHDIFPVAWDELGRKWRLNERKCWRYMHEKGARIMTTSKPWHLGHTGYCEDFANYGGFVKDLEEARKWHAVGGRITTYASPHTGPENPDFIRRTHGMILYKLDLDGTCNYMYYEGDPNLWNEFNKVKNQYRCFNMVYPTQYDVIDTLAWEGFREAIDDIRYCTLLRQLALKETDAKNVEKRYAARKALLYLSAFDAEKGDLTTMRLGIIRHILKLRELFGA